MKRTKIYTWKNHINPVFVSVDNSNDYESIQNAKNVARLFYIGLPSNTCNVIYQAIASEIMTIVKNGNVDLLMEPHDIENRIRCAMMGLQGD